MWPSIRKGEVLLSNDNQEPRSNFEIWGGGGGGTVSDWILGDGGGTGHLFLLTFYNTKNIGGGQRSLTIRRVVCRSLGYGFRLAWTKMG